MSKEMLELADRIEGTLPQLVTNVDKDEKADAYRLIISSSERQLLSALLRASAVAEPMAWQRRNIGKDGQPWSIWYTTNSGPSPEKCAWDGVYSYEYRALYAHPAPAAPVPASVPDPHEIDYDDPRFNQGVEHVVDMLARTIGAEGWHAGDGSEDYDCDLEETLRNILAARGLYDRDTGEFASLPEPAAVPTREGRHPVESLWRECGLPEYFLGNDGSNTKLYALYDAILALKAAPAK